MKENIMKKTKTLATGILLLGVLYWSGSPWQLQDDPSCNTVIGADKGSVNCGAKAFYHTTLREYLIGVQEKLIDIVVGSRPVMMNMAIKEPNACDTGLTIGDGVDHAYFAHDSFIGQDNPKSCPIFEMKGASK